MFQHVSYLLKTRHGNDSPTKHKKESLSGNRLPVRLRSEVNGLVYPFFFLNKAKDTHVIETKMTRRIGNETIEAVWRVIPHPASGRPGPFAQRVHRAVEQLITQRGLPITNPVAFSIHNLCRRMGIRAAGGTEYRKVRQALVAIRGTQVESKGTFYAKAHTRYIDQVFSLYERIIFTGERLPDGKIAEKNLLYLGTWYLESLNSLYVKPLDYDYYLKLHTPIARRLYELLGVKFYGVVGKPHPLIRYRYSTLSRLLPVKRHRYRSRMRQQLGPAHDELTRGEFLQPTTDFPRSHENDWYIVYRPGPKAIAEIRASKTNKNNYKNKNKKYRAHSSGLHGGRHGSG